MLTKTIVTLMTLGLAITANAADTSKAAAADSAKHKDTVAKVVPNAKKTLKQDGSEFEVLTAKDTVVEVEFNQDGSIDEASGDAAAAGDVLVPGNGLISLSDAVTSLKKAGKTPSGEWSFEKSFTSDWVYEFEGTENGKKMDYAVSAKDGKLVKDRRDVL